LFEQYAYIIAIPFLTLNHFEHVFFFISQLIHYVIDSRSYIFVLLDVTLHHSSSDINFVVQLNLNVIFAAHFHNSKKLVQSVCFVKGSFVRVVFWSLHCRATLVA